MFARSWLGREGIVYCGHNVLYWLPFLRAIGGLRCAVVSLLFAREPLDFARSHQGIIALTRAAADHAKKLAPNVRIAHLGWGADLSVYPKPTYRPEAFFSSGIAVRDFDTLSLAAARCSQRIAVIVPGTLENLRWSDNVAVIDGGSGWSFQQKRLSFCDIRDQYHARSSGSLIVVKPDPAERIACGFTEMLDAMAMARPVVLTRTGALPTEIDVEKEGCGLFVPPGDPDALAKEIDYLGRHPDVGEAMGRKGRELIERHYNIERYGDGLHAFFESL